MYGRSIAQIDSENSSLRNALKYALDLNEAGRLYFYKLFPEEKPPWGPKLADSGLDVSRINYEVSWFGNMGHTDYISL